jgi:integrase
MANSTRRRSGAKPRKPPFPLWLHPTGQWGKKIRGRCYYFGKDRDAALKEYLRVKDDLEAGRRPSPAEGKQLTLRDLCNAFLTHKQHQVKTGELAARSFEDYYSSCNLLLKHLGKTTTVEQVRPEDLLRYRRMLAKTRSATSVGNEVNRVRVILRFAFENGLTERPVRFGGFKRPSKSVIRRQRSEKGPRMFEAAEIRKLLEATQGQLRAMILLGVNCGLGNADCGMLPLSAIDLAGAWLDFPRPKSGIPRRCPLWPEAVDALQSVIANRKPPANEDAEDRVFVTKYGKPWYRDGKPMSAVSHEFRKLLDRLDLHRPGVGFYALRHTFQTIGDETGDYLAVRRIMGHADSSISDAYRERFPDERLRRVTEHVRAWLFG